MQETSLAFYKIYKTLSKRIWKIKYTTSRPFWPMNWTNAKEKKIFMSKNTSKRYKMHTNKRIRKSNNQ